MKNVDNEKLFEIPKSYAKTINALVLPHNHTGMVLGGFQKPFTLILINWLMKIMPTHSNGTVSILIVFY